MDEIVDPVSNRRYNIHSSSAREILRNYIINYKTGGSTPLPPVEEPWYAKYFSPLLDILPPAQYPDREGVSRLLSSLNAIHDDRMNLINGLIQRASRDSIEHDLLIIRLGRLKLQKILFNIIFNEYLKHMERRNLVNASDFKTVFYPRFNHIFFREGHNNFSRNLFTNYVKLFGDLNIPKYILNFPVVSISRERGLHPQNHHMIDYLESGFGEDGWITNLMQTIDEDSEMEEDTDYDEPDLPNLPLIQPPISHMSDLN